MKKHYIISETHGIIFSCEDYKPAELKAAIIKQLIEHPKDSVDHCKDFNKADARKYYGHELINSYEINPNNGKPSKLIYKGDKTFYKSLVD